MIGGIGGLAKSVSSPDDSAANTVSAVGGGVSDLGSALPVIGIPLVAIGEGLKIVGGLMDNFTKMAEKYGEYNPAIAQAQAMAEVKKIMGDMRRAQESGQELVKFVKLQAETQQRFEDLKMKIWMKILPMLNDMLEGINYIANLGRDKLTDLPNDPTDFILNPEEVRKVREGSTGPLTSADILA